MSGQATVSIVVPVMALSRRLADTLQSLVAQKYSAFDVVVHCARDAADAVEEARQLVRQHPTMLQLRESGPPDLAGLLNEGFDVASGQILGYVRPGALLMPGTLERVAEHLSQHPVAIGGSCFLFPDLPATGVEHAAGWHGRFEHLAVWQRGFDWIAASSLFWRRSAWIRAGGARPGEPESVAYDLVCRFARDFAIHPAPEIWSAQWVEPRAAAPRSDAELLEVLIGVSRAHWGPWWRALRWRCEASYRLHLMQRHEHARHHARRSEAARAEGRRLVALAHALATWAWSPSMARGRFGTRLGSAEADNL